MLKKLAVPFLTLTLAAFGCSSSTTSTPGTGGSGGGAAGSSAAGSGGGAAGSSAAGSGGGAAGSSAAGSGGGAAGSSAAGSGGGGKAGGGGGATAGSGGGGKAGGGGGGGGAKGDAGVSMADCTVTDSAGTDVLSASVFCAQMAAYCPSQFTTEGACTSTYNTSGQQHCRSYHMCWGVEGLTNTAGAKPTVHCPHTIGVGLCMVTDASVGN